MRFVRMVFMKKNIGVFVFCLFKLKIIFGKVLWYLRIFYDCSYSKSRFLKFRCFYQYNCMLIEGICFNYIELFLNN